MNDIVKDRIIELAGMGKSQREISRILGVPRSTVQYQLAKVDTPQGAVQRWIVLPDPHVPHQDERTNEALLHYIMDHKWDGWLCLGDLCDFDAISHWTKSQIRLVQGKSVMNQYKTANAYLEQHYHALAENNPDVRMVLLEGNHDYWVERYIDENPAMEGMLEVENNLDAVKDGRCRWIRSWSKGEVFNLGHAHFVHGDKITKYHARVMAEQYGTNIFYGHTHDIQSYTYERKGDGKAFCGQSLGCLCEYQQSYMRGRPSKWQQAFAVFYVLPSGNFYYYIVRVFDNKFVSPEGKEYGG